MFGLSILKSYRINFGTAIALLAIANLSLTLSACSSTDSSDSEISTETNRSAIETSPAIETSSESNGAVNRVIALSSLSADILATLDRSKLVGVPSSSLVQSNAKLAEIEQIGAGQNPNLESIVAQKPDLVVGVEGMQSEILGRLEELGISTLSYKVGSLEDLENLTVKLAEAIGVDPTALLERYQNFVPPTVEVSDDSVLLLAGSKPILSPNRNSWAGNLLETFQVNNVAAEWQGQSPFRGYVTLVPEKILDANPDTILVIAAPVNENAIEGFQSLAFWDDLKATQSDRVYVFDYYGLVNPGSLDKIEEACLKLSEVLGQSDR